MSEDTLKIGDQVTWHPALDRSLEKKNGWIGTVVDIGENNTNIGVYFPKIAAVKRYYSLYLVKLRVQDGDPEEYNTVRQDRRDE